MNLAELSHQAAIELASGNYAQAATLYEHLADAEPDNKHHSWAYGLTLLLQHREEEAQSLWMLALMEGDDAQIEQWTTELATVLSTEAERQQQQQQFTVAWALRQYLRELRPIDCDNLMQLLQLSLQLGVSQSIELIEHSIVPLLNSDSGQQVSIHQRLALLRWALEQLPTEPITLTLAAACIADLEEVGCFIEALMETAIELAHARHRPDLAIQYANLCLEIYPNELSTLSHLSTFQQRNGQHAEGIETAKQWCLLAQTLPEQVFGAFLLLSAYLQTGDYWNDIFTLFDLQQNLILELTEPPLQPLDQTTTMRLMTTTFFQPYLRDDLAQNRRIQNRLFQLCQAGVRSYAADQAQRYEQGLAQRPRPAVGDRPLKIGYLTHCFQRHSVGWLARWLVQHHNRDRVQVYGYLWNFHPRPHDQLQQWYLNHLDEVRTFERDGLPIAEQIYRDEIDILIDLDSITADIACEVMALKPAPVQVTWLGWDASGMPAIDYFIVDPYVVPDDADQHYAEKLWRLPQTYLAVDGFEVGVPTLRRADLEVPDDAVIYMSSQSSYKRHPATVRCQMEIIKAVPNSYFLIKGITEENPVQDYFCQIAAEVGVSRDRLRFLSVVAKEEEHRANLSIADVVLDTYPYNGATTTMETLWMGIPLVTRMGNHFSSRNSYTMLVNAGIDTGIARTDAEYIEWGIRYGTDAALRQQVAMALRRSRQTAPLWNAKAFTNEMENAYEGMWQRYQARNI